MTPLLSVPRKYAFCSFLRAPSKQSGHRVCPSLQPTFVHTIKISLPIIPIHYWLQLWAPVLSPGLCGGTEKLWSNLWCFLSRALCLPFKGSTTSWSSRNGESPLFLFKSITFLFKSAKCSSISMCKKREEWWKKIDGEKKNFLNITAISYHTALLEQ